MGSDVEENLCQHHLSNSQHSLVLLIAGVNEVLFKAGGITFSLVLSAVLLGVTETLQSHTPVYLCVVGEAFGKGWG